MNFFPKKCGVLFLCLIVCLFLALSAANIIYTQLWASLGIISGVWAMQSMSGNQENNDADNQAAD